LLANRMRSLVDLSSLAGPLEQPTPLPNGAGPVD
jgi:hypothetical protein